MMYRWVLIVILLATAGLPGTSPADAASCQFVLGFKSLHDLIPTVVGNCVVDEHHNATNGDALQETTGFNGAGGLLVWRKADNWTAYTDGFHTWVNGPYGLQERLNTQRYCWEGDAPRPCMGRVPVNLPAVQPRKLVWALRAPVPVSPISGFEQPYSPVGQAVAVNGRIFTFGTCADECARHLIEAYDPVTNVWTTWAEIPSGYGGGSATVSQGQAYFLGGAPPGGSTSTSFQAYDPATNRGRSWAPLPEPYAFVQIVAASGRIFALGGYTQSGLTETFHGDVMAYDPGTNTWTPRASMTIPRARFGAAAAPNGHIYVVGGANRSNMSSMSPSILEEYDPSTDSWMTRAPMPTLRADVTLVALANGRLLAIGGQGEQGNSHVFALNTVEEYDPAMNAWWTQTNLPGALANASIGVIDDHVYVAGGSCGLNCWSNSLLVGTEE